MTSFQLSVSHQRRVAARFVENVRRRLQLAYAASPDVSQSDIAREIGVHRSVINRQLRGYQDMGLTRVAELSWALGYEPVFDLVPRVVANGCEAAEAGSDIFASKTKTAVTDTKLRAPDLEAV